MKPIRLAASLLLFALLIGCAATRPPNKLETTFYTVTTNVITVTNFVPVVVYETQKLSQAGITIDLPPQAVTSYVVQVEYVTNYSIAPNATADAVASAGGAIGSYWGAGGLASTLLAGLFGLWAAWRNSRTSKTAVTLAQIIETGRQVLKSTPQGQALDAQWVQWMVKHQTEAGVITEVVKLLGQVRNADAQIAAQKLLELMKARQSAPA